MSERAKESETDRLIAGLLSDRQIGRRRFLQGSAAASMAAFIAACGGSSAVTPRPTGPLGQVKFGNWPLYIDIDDETGAYPTLEKFKAETGIAYTYAEDINDNEEFFNKIQPDLAAHRNPGYDLIAPTDWMIERLVRLGYVQELDKSLLPNFTANVQPLYADPWFDPGNKYSITWTSGIVGIGYNPTLTGRPITTFDDLLDPAFKGRVGMFSEMRDTMCLTLLSLGVKPVDATVDDATRAQQKLLTAAQSGQFRAFYGNDYYDQLAAGNLALSIAWSGDISQMKLYDNADVEFIQPDTGSMLYTDNMVIPNNVDHPIDAHMLMDFWYDVENAAALTEYIGYYSPVKGVAELIKEHADAARADGDIEDADALDVVSETAFPTTEQLANTYTYKVLTEAEEREWNDLFNEVVSG